MERFVYADNAATTPVAEKVANEMMPFLTKYYGNASSLYSIGRDSRKAIMESREKVASLIKAQPAEIIFTGSGTEADNMALKGIMHSKRAKGKHLITSSIEHHAILHTAKTLEKEGFEVTYLPVDKDGLILIDELKAAIRPDTALVSIMMANNEIGTIEPIAEIGAICRDAGVLFHTDAVQAAGHISIDVNEMKIDLLSLSGHKMNAPKGIGALYIRKGVMINPIIDGGGQERNLRSGTENTAGIVALGVAAAEAESHMQENITRLTAMRDRLIEGVLKIPYCHLTGHPKKRLPGTASFVIEAIEGESLVLLLDLNGICGSTGSACSTGSLDPSHVLTGIGLSHDIAHGSLRLTLGVQNNEEDVDYILEKLPQVVERLRSMSPVWDAQKNCPSGLKV
ncbi:MAG: cysteine desulfurase NifS [Clostridiales bacterium]|nr:cysteine desulfurase NifS [Clostridiales bacterium]